MSKDDREDKRQIKLSLDYRLYYCIITLHYLITFGIQSEYYTADILAVLFETHFIARCPIISGRSSQSTILRDAVRVSRTSARSVTPVTITPPSMTPASRNFIVIPINRRPFSPVSPLVISSLTLSGLALAREGNGIRVCGSRRGILLPPPPSRPTSPPFLPQHPLPRSVLHRSCRVHSSRRFLAFTLSLSLPLSSTEMGYTSAEESGASAAR